MWPSEPASNSSSFVLPLFVIPGRAESASPE
jgi:hypothetical protein